MIQVGQADCVAFMHELDEDFFDAIVTDPPYGLSFMGKKWDRLPHQWHERWATEALRVLKPGGHLLSFGGTRTYHRLATGIEDAGLEIRDCVVWLYGSGFPKSHNLKGQHTGLGTALKPAHEPIVVARKPLTGTVAANVLEHGTGALNIDATRIGVGKDVPASISRHAVRADGVFEGNRDGSWRNERGGPGSGHDPNTGRWPANVVLDEEAAVMLDEQVGERPRGYASPSSPGLSGEVYGKGSGRGFEGGYADTGGPSRFFYCAKASSAERNAGLDGVECVSAAELTGRREGSAGLIMEGGKANPHPTVKPVALMQWLVRLVTPPGGCVFDPFVGSGTTGIACVREGFDFVGVDTEAEYVRIAKARIRHAISERGASGA